MYMKHENNNKKPKYKIPLNKINIKYEDNKNNS